MTQSNKALFFPSHILSITPYLVFIAPKMILFISLHPHLQDGSTMLARTCLSGSTYDSLWPAQSLTHYRSLINNCCNGVEKRKREGNEEKWINPGPSDPKVILPLLKVIQGRFRRTLGRTIGSSWFWGNTDFPVGLPLTITPSLHQSTESLPTRPGSASSSEGKQPMSYHLEPTQHSVQHLRSLQKCRMLKRRASSFWISGQMSPWTLHRCTSLLFMACMKATVGKDGAKN